jgi:hypothetical protein
VRESDRESEAVESGVTDSEGPPWRLITAGVAVVVSVVIAGLGWSVHGSDARHRSAAGPNDLSIDQAACLRFGLVAARSDAYHLGVALGSYSTIDPDAAARLREEVAALDALPSSFPAADYRLIRSMSESADAGSLVLANGGLVTYRELVSSRSAAMAKTAELCHDLAGFDTAALSVDGGGAEDG